MVSHKSLAELGFPQVPCRAGFPTGLLLSRSQQTGQTKSRDKIRVTKKNHLSPSRSQPLKLYKNTQFILKKTFWFWCLLVADEGFPQVPCSVWFPTCLLPSRVSHRSIADLGFSQVPC